MLLLKAVVPVRVRSEEELWRVHAWLAMIEHGDISFASKLTAALRVWL